MTPCNIITVTEVDSNEKFIICLEHCVCLCVFSDNSPCSYNHNLEAECLEVRSGD